MELLAPAKDMDALLCAYDAGADAVYVGLTKFSARARARNLTIEELYKASDIKKKINKKLYIALNTLIFEDEIPELIEILLHLKSAEIDGVIIQDYGVYQLMKDLDIKIPIHASTQMGTKNHIQAKFLEDLGFKRVILERQLSLDEIKSIRNHTNIELEVFVHGAMCFALSGHCFFSKMLGNRSGNRGDCAQPCRWSFRDITNNKTIRPFFMKDLSAITLLPVLKNIGINSLKIEGRLKGIEYVYKVVSIYREALDTLHKIRDVKDLEHFEKDLQNIAFTRQTGKGFFNGIFSQENIINVEQDSVGLFAGTISSIYEKTIFFKTIIPINIGDGLRILNSDDTSFKLPVKAIYKNNKKVRSADSGDYIGVPCNIKGISKNAKIYLVNHRFHYKSNIKIPTKIYIPDVREKINSFIEKYKKQYVSSYNNPVKIKLQFEPEKFYNFYGKNFVFVTPDVYESKIDFYRNISENQRIDGVFISHPSEAQIFQKKEVYGSFYLYVTNKSTGYFMKSFNIKAFSLSPDLDNANFSKIKHISPLWIVWENLPLWITRVQIGKNSIIKSLNNKKITIKGYFGFKG